MKTIHMSGKNIYLDANVFIYLLEGYEEFSQILTKIFEKIDSGLTHSVTSELTLAETLAKPVLDKNINLQKIYEHTIQSSPLLNVVPVSREILVAAARLRQNSIRLPDAIHLATANSNHCDLFLTNDKQLKNASSCEVILLSEIKESSVL